MSRFLRRCFSSLNSQRPSPFTLSEQTWIRVHTEGPITVANFMQEALCHPTQGYYMQRDVFGTSGDFITSPEISQMFGELLGVWCVHAWQQMGQPKEVHVVELGPGRGTLMADLLRAVRKFSDFHLATGVHLVEISPALRQIQQGNLGIESVTNTETVTKGSRRDGVPVSWHTSLNTIPKGPALFIAQEFFDALPIHQFQFTERGWCEVLIDVDEMKPSPKLRYALSPKPNVNSQTLLSPKLVPTLPPNPAIGERIEVSPLSWKVASMLGDYVCNNNGAAIIIDYGRNGHVSNSLQAVKNHQFHDPLEDIGHADITAHVDFSALLHAAKDTLGSSLKARTFGPVTQSEFLHRLGIRERLEKLCENASPQAQNTLISGYERLVSPEQMGELFKVAAIGHPSLELAGFDSQ